MLSVYPGLCELPNLLLPDAGNPLGLPAQADCFGVLSLGRLQDTFLCQGLQQALAGDGEGFALPLAPLPDCLVRHLRIQIPVGIVLPPDTVEGYSFFICILGQKADLPCLQQRLELSQEFQGGTVLRDALRLFGCQLIQQKHMFVFDLPGLGLAHGVGVLEKAQQIVHADPKPGDGLRHSAVAGNSIVI